MPDSVSHTAALAERADAAREASAAAPSLLRDFWELTKPEISFLVAISALAGFLLGSPDGIAVWTLLFTLLGVALTAGGVGVLNHYLERDLDARMRRTADRPLPAGRVAPEVARNMGYGLVAAGIGILCPLANPLTASLAGLTVLLYLYVYTPLKQKTTYNTLIGTIPGALPALGGYTAATGSLGAGGWAIFAILAAWQMPHFLSLAWMYRKDYARAGYAMLPVVEPDGASTARQTVFFTVLLLLASLSPVWLDAASWWYGAGALLLGLWFLVTSLRFYYRRTGQMARRVLVASIVYIPVLVGLLLVDHFI